MLQCRLARAPGGTAGAGRDRRQPLAGHGGRTDGAAPGELGVFPAGAKLNRRDRARRFTDKQGHSVLAVIQPVDNAPECSNAACHVHPAGQQVLGVIDANLSLDTVDVQMAQHQANLWLFLIGAIVLGSALAVLFIWTVVYRPVKKLIDGTHRVADGDLSYRLPAGSDGEPGDLARSFNKMTAKVEGVQAEIEERVRRKTAELEKIHQK